MARSVNEGDSRSEIEHQILSYLMKNPAAKDTAAGIFEWWLKSPQQWSASAVEEAIEDLVERQWILVTQLKTGVPLYGLNPDAQRSIERAIEKQESRWRT